MRPTISQLRAWDTGALGSAGGVAAANASILDGALDSAVRSIDGAGSWFGLTRDAANTRIDQERDHGHVPVGPAPEPPVILAPGPDFPR